MDVLKQLKVLLQEEKYPRFSDEELNTFLEVNNGEIYSTASQLCILKADEDQEITVGPIKIKGPGANYWLTLSDKYAERAKSKGGSTSSGYKTMMERVDDVCYRRRF